MAERIVVKLGTNTLGAEDGLPDGPLMAALAADIRALRDAGTQVILVSSGAIGFGRAALGLRELPLDVPMRQACAAVGQHRLMQAWDEALGRHELRVAQVLLTSHTFQHRRRYVELHNCLEAILAADVIPILNENDAVSTEEIDATFTDNDRLGALVAARVDADLYVVLSDVDGLYDRPPGEPGAAHIPRVERVDDAVLAMAGKPGKRGRGGMRTKLESVRSLAEAGVPSVIAAGRPGVLPALLGDAPPGTWFDAVGRRDGMRRWLMAATPEGTVRIDAGAADALRAGNHLLPAGIVAVEGTFPVESVVTLADADGPVARALVPHSSRDLDRAKGLQSEAAHDVLGGAVNVTRKGRLLLL